MKRLFTLIALVCLVGVNLLAQDLPSLGVIDFTGLTEVHPRTDFTYNNFFREVEGRLLYISSGRQIRIRNTDNNWEINFDDGNNSYLKNIRTNYDGGYWASVFINGLKQGDKVKITPKGELCFGNNMTQELQSYNYFTDERTFTITSDDELEVKTRNQNDGIYKIEVFGDGGSDYNYDPSVEGYDLYWVGGGATYEKIEAGFTLDTSGKQAILLTQLSDHTPLSRRIAISQNSDGSTPWSLSNFSSDINQASQGLYNSDENTWHNISITNLKAGARVRITFHNEDYSSERNEGHAKFGSVGYSTYNGCAAFQDTNNNGTQDAGELSVEAGLNLVGYDNSNDDYVTYFYTITQDGHLDLAFDGKVRICQVEIYNDHLATMVDRDNGSHETGYTSYFNNTGELQTKVHTVPGGLRVLVGSEDENQHAGVVASPTDPMAFVYDASHRKFPRNSSSDFNNDLTDNLPYEGTFHRFIPEVDGKMIVKFFTTSINYLWPQYDGNYSDLDNTSNENAVDVNCPYYLIKVDQNGNKEIVKTTSSYNEEITWEEDVKAGYTYYLFGGWSAGANANNYSEQKSEWMKKNKHGCGVPNLLDVTFIVEKVVRPLAKWIENASEEDNNLAYVKGYKTVKVKKMSGNIESCHPYLDGNTLKIDQIVYKDGDVNKGGVVLIEITDDANTYDRTDPVFALTVAYDAAYHSDNQHAETERGHTWDFSSSPLKGLEWTNYSGYADDLEFGTYYVDYFDGNTNLNSENTLLSREMNWTDIHGTQHSDWTFGYRQQNQGNSYDPQLLNHYDLVGDNADMIWNTEGMVLLASANHNSIFNEFKGDVHDSSTDPDRYVGIWHGSSGYASEFLIPWLDKDDRVIIWMGSGSGTGNEQMKFKITNARDAEYKEISENDYYIAGGSQWNGANGDNNYRGCYHFFAKEKGDMRFELIDEGDGSYPMCKIYKIQIYHGDRINTNEIKGATENDNHYLLWSRDNDPNDNTGKDIGPTYNWTLNYFGKDQKLADGSNGVNNGIPVYDARPIKTGVSINLNGFTTSTETDPTKPTYNTFKYTHDYGQIGTFRMRGKDMEKNMKYVADYAEHNVTVAYQQTQPYPYTWDLKDMIGFGNNNFLYEDQFSVTMPEWYGGNTTDWNKSYEKSSTDLRLWKNFESNGYTLRLNSQTQNGEDLKVRDNIFETAKDIEGNQLWANGFIVPESQGLWFYTNDNNQNHGPWRISDAGMTLDGFEQWSYKLVVPNVPAGAAVYLRMTSTKMTSVDGQPVNQAYFNAEFKSATNANEYEVYNPTLVSGTNGTYIFAIQNNASAKRNLTLSFGGYQLRKLAVSTDAKRIAQSGFATESRANDIDHELTAYLTGLPIKAYTAKLTRDHSKVLLTQFGASETEAKILPDANKDGNVGGCILYHEGYVETTSGDKDHTVSILGGGFHEFVPDMHDKVNANLKVPTTTENIIIPFIPERDLENNEDIYVVKDNYLKATDGDYTNMILSTKKYSYGTNGASIDNNGYEAFFVRVDPKGNSGQGAKMWKCTGYIQIPTDDLKPLSGSSSTTGTTTTTGNAKLTIVFEDELFGEINNGIATGISEVNEQNASDGKAEWYSLDGQKLNGVPTAKGLYIVNGKKVLVK